MVHFDRAVPTDDGHFVSEKHARISEIIQDFNPYLQLVWIPPENRTDDNPEPPYAIMDTTPGKQPYVIFTIKEDELDERVLARLFQADLSQHDVLARLEATERAAEVVRLKERMDKAEEHKDFVKSVVGSGKHSFRHNGRIIPT
jgi:hypothetical protein